VKTDATVKRPGMALSGTVGCRWLTVLAHHGERHEPGDDPGDVPNTGELFDGDDSAGLGRYRKHIGQTDAGEVVDREVQQLKEAALARARRRP
jgi:hypothetical protein